VTNGTGLAGEAAAGNGCDDVELAVTGSSDDRLAQVVGVLPYDFEGMMRRSDLWLPLASSLACAMAVGLGFEAWRRWQKRRGKDILGDELPPEMSAG